MDDQPQTFAEHFIAQCHAKNDFIMLDDGFYSYWPDKLCGAYTEYTIEVILAELKRLNAPHKAELDAYFEGHKRKDRDGPEAVEFFTQAGVPF